MDVGAGFTNQVTQSVVRIAWVDGHYGSWWEEKRWYESGEERRLGALARFTLWWEG